MSKIKHLVCGTYSVPEHGRFNP